MSNHNLFLENLQNQKRSIVLNQNGEQNKVMKFIGGDNIVYKNIFVQNQNQKGYYGQIYENNDTMVFNSNNLQMNGNLNVQGNALFNQSISANSINASGIYLNGIPINTSGSSLSVTNFNSSISVSGNITVSNNAFINDKIVMNKIKIQNQLGQINNYQIAIGHQAGLNNQGQEAIAIGYYAGAENQLNGVAIGYAAGALNQGGNSIAIGSYAGNQTQGLSCVAIGTNAGRFSQHNNTIILNASSGEGLNSKQANSFYVKPIRKDNSPGLQFLNYSGNNGSGEITYKSLGYAQLSYVNDITITQNLAITMIHNNIGPYSGITYTQGEGLITFENTGVYKIGTSILYQQNLNNDAETTFWFQKNGINIPNTGTKVYIPKSRTTVAYAEIITEINSSGTIGIYSYTTESGITSISISGVNGGINVPLCPAIITTITQLS